MIVLEKIKKYWPILFILVLGSLPLVWFRDGLLIAGGDNDWYLNPVKLFHDALYTWSGLKSAGEINFLVCHIFPLPAFWALLKLVGLSLVNIQRLWTILIFVTPALSIYYLVIRYFGADKKEVKYQLVGLLAAILYSFNMFLINSPLNSVASPVLAIMPLMLWFFISALEQEKFSFKYPAAISVLSIFLFFSNTNLAEVSIIPLVLGLYLLFFVAFNFKFFKIVHAFKVVVASVVAYLAVNSWWLLIISFSFVEAASKAGEIVKSISFVERSYLFEVFRLMGFWAFRIKTGAGLSNVPYSDLYYQPLLIILTYLIPLVVFFALIFRPRDKKIIFFSLIFLLGIFLAKGTNEPFGVVYGFLFEKIPGFWVFRNPYSKFMPLTIFGFSILYGLSAADIYYGAKKWFVTKIKNRQRAVAMALIILVFLGLLPIAAAWPILTGKFLSDASWYGTPEKSMHVQVPDYWQQANKWFTENDPEGRVLLLPKAGYGHCYKWLSGICTGGYVANYLIPNPIISYPNLKIDSPYDNTIDSLFSYIKPQTRVDLAELLGVFNIKYILQQDDLLWQRAGTDSYSPEQIKNILAEQPGIEFIKNFGKLNLYQIKGDYYVQRIFAPRKVSYTSSKDPLETSQAVLLNKKNVTEESMFEIKDGLDSSDKDLIATKRLADTNGYSLDIPAQAEYDFYLIQKPISPQVVVCAGCPSGFGISLGDEYSGKQLFFTKAISGGVYFDNDKKISLSWRRSIKIYPLDVNDVGIDSPIVGWSFIQNVGAVDLYGSQLSENFPEDYKTSSEAKIFFAGFRDGQQLGEDWGVEIFPDSFEIGTMKTRRVVVSVPAGTRPGEGYRFVYLKKPSMLSDLDFGSNVGTSSVLSVGSASLAAGNHRVLLTGLTSEDLDKMTFVAKKKVVEGGVVVPKITFKKINPTKYKVMVSGAVTDFSLVFSENFNTFWRVYVFPQVFLSQRELSGKPFSPVSSSGPVDADFVSEEYGGSTQNNNLTSPFYKTYFRSSLGEHQHFLANGYANGWWIKRPDCLEQGDKCQNFEIIIEFWPQRIYYLGGLISGLSFCLILFYLIKKIRSRE
ncbi:MAG: alpha-(1-_3)-arabinofuranosyltransferase family protein [Patescibacteria group bacterium]|jgi:hypothetical protein